MVKKVATLKSAEEPRTAGNGRLFAEFLTLFVHSHICFCHKARFNPKFKVQDLLVPPVFYLLLSLCSLPARYRQGSSDAYFVQWLGYRWSVFTRPVIAFLP